MRTIKRFCIVGIFLCLIQLVVEPVIAENIDAPVKASSVLDVCEPSDVAAFTLSFDDYYEFVKNPSISFITERPYGMHGEVFRLTNIPGQEIERVYLSNGQQCKEYWKDGTYRLQGTDNFPVYKALIEFAGNTQAIQDFLREKNIDVTVVDATLIGSAFLPNFVWVQCTEGSYMFTFKVFYHMEGKSLSDIQPDLLEGSVFEIYDAQSFSEEVVKQRPKYLKAMDEYEYRMRLPLNILYAVRILAIAGVGVSIFVVSKYLIKRSKKRKQEKQ